MQRRAKAPLRTPNKGIGGKSHPLGHRTNAEEGKGTSYDSKQMQRRAKATLRTPNKCRGGKKQPP
jgi:hypothetical protein